VGSINKQVAGTQVVSKMIGQISGGSSPHENKEKKFVSV
jgi:hypothetical protein